MMALNNREKWIVFHKSSMNEYLDLWKDSDLRSQIEISLEETAYYLLENAAALWRYTGNEVYKNDFKDFPLEERKKLVSAACKYINSSSLPEQARKITVTDALSDDKIDQAESIFLLRDGLQGVLDISKCVVDDILLNATANEVLSAFSVVVFDDYDTVSLASPFDYLNKVYDYIRMLDAEGYPKAFLNFGNFRLEFLRASLKNGYILFKMQTHGCCE